MSDSSFDGIFNFPFGGSQSPENGALPGTSRDIFGEDVLFNTDTILTRKGDYSIVMGEDNLSRSVWRRLVTRPGEYKTNPSYGVGIYSYLKKPTTKSNLDELRHRIIDNLGSERRIDKVLEVDVTEMLFGSDTGIRIVISVQAFGRTQRLKPFNFTSTQSGF